MLAVLSGATCSVHLLIWLWHSEYAPGRIEIALASTSLGIGIATRVILQSRTKFAGPIALLGLAMWTWIGPFFESTARRLFIAHSGISWWQRPCEELLAATTMGFVGFAIATVATSACAQLKAAGQPRWLFASGIGGFAGIFVVLGQSTANVRPWIACARLVAVATSALWMAQILRCRHNPENSIRPIATPLRDNTHIPFGLLGTIAGIGMVLVFRTAFAGDSTITMPWRATLPLALTIAACSVYTISRVTRWLASHSEIAPLLLSLPSILIGIGVSSTLAHSYGSALPLVLLMAPATAALGGGLAFHFDLLTSAPANQGHRRWMFGSAIGIILVGPPLHSTVGLWNTATLLTISTAVVLGTYMYRAGRPVRVAILSGGACLVIGASFSPQRAQFWDDDLGSIYVDSLPTRSASRPIALSVLSHPSPQRVALLGLSLPGAGIVTKSRDLEAAIIVVPDTRLVSDELVVPMQHVPRPPCEYLFHTRNNFDVIVALLAPARQPRMLSRACLSFARSRLSSAGVLWLWLDRRQLNATQLAATADRVASLFPYVTLWWTAEAMGIRGATRSMVVNESRLDTAIGPFRETTKWETGRALLDHFVGDWKQRVASEALRGTERLAPSVQTIVERLAPLPARGLTLVPAHGRPGWSRRKRHRAQPPP